MAESFETILYEADGAVATITMNRPDVANAQDSDAHRRDRRRLRPGRRRRRRPGRDPGRGGQALLLRPRPQGPGRRRRAPTPGWRCARPRGQVPPREDDVLRPLPADPRLPQADHRRRAGQLRRRRAHAGRHVRPHRGRRRRRVLQPGAAPHRGRRGAAGRALGARDPQGQGVPLHRRHHRRPGGLAPRPGQPCRAPGGAGGGRTASWPTGSPSSRRSRPRRSRTPSTTPRP